MCWSKFKSHSHSRLCTFLPHLRIFLKRILDQWVNKIEVCKTGIGSRCDVGLVLLAVLNHRVLLTQQLIAFYGDFVLRTGVLISP
jgi:hypothetical protein